MWNTFFWHQLEVKNSNFVLGFFWEQVFIPLPTSLVTLLVYVWSTFSWGKIDSRGVELISFYSTMLLCGIFFINFLLLKPKKTLVYRISFSIFWFTRGKELVDDAWVRVRRKRRLFCQVPILLVEKATPRFASTVISFWIQLHDFQNNISSIFL